MEMEERLRATESSGNRFGLLVKLAGKLAKTWKSSDRVSTPEMGILDMDSRTKAVSVLTCLTNS